MTPIASTKSTDGEERGPDDVAGFHFFGEVAKFLDAFDGHAVLFLDVAEQRLGEALFLLVVEAELDGVVAVLARLGLDLQHAVGAAEDDGDVVGDSQVARHRRGFCPSFFPISPSGMDRGN